MEKIDIIEDIAANVGNKVSIRGKVVYSEKIKAKDRVFVKRECVFGDASKASRLVLWEDLVDSVENSKCYTISNVVVIVGRNIFLQQTILKLKRYLT